MTVNLPNPNLRDMFLVLAIGLGSLALWKASSAPAVTPAPAPAPPKPGPPTPAPTPSPAPAPLPPPVVSPLLVLAIDQYDATLPSCFADLAARVRKGDAGDLKNEAAVVAAMGVHSAQLIQSLKSTLAQFSGADGTISDAAGLATVLDQAAASVAANHVAGAK